MAARKSSRVHRKDKTKYRIRNWREYERALRSRGDVTILLSAEAIAAWTPPKNGLPGGQRRYSDLAILTALTLPAPLPPPAAPDRRFPRLAAQVDGPRPQGLGPRHSLTPESNRRGTEVQPLTRAHHGPINLIINSTGLKILDGPASGPTRAQMQSCNNAMAQS